MADKDLIFEGSQLKIRSELFHMRTLEYGKLC